MSISSEKPMSARPYDESAPPAFLDLPPKLKMQTPAVISATCRYSRTENFLPPRRTPPAITGTILHDLPSTCVGNETKRSASFEPACHRPRLRLTQVVRDVHVPWHLEPRAAEEHDAEQADGAEMPRSNSSVSSVYWNFSCSSPYSVLYTSSVSVAE